VSIDVAEPPGASETLVGLSDVVVVFAIMGDGPDTSATVPEKLSRLCNVIADVADDPCWTLRRNGFETMLKPGVVPFDSLHAVSGWSSHEEYPCPGLDGGCQVTNP
jgi:hypothetical protein